MTDLQHTTSTDQQLPPTAPLRFGFRVRDIHGDHFDDGWDWLRDDSNPEVIAHLNAENTYADAVCAPTADLAASITAEVKAHAAVDDVSVPVRDGDFWYFTRFAKGASYAAHYRVPAESGPMSADVLPPAPAPTADAPLPGETLLVDENAQAKGEEFFRLADLVPSPDGRLIAWARDTVGDERYTWVVQDAATGEILDEAVVDSGYGFAWAADSRSFIYTGVDEAWRACEVWWHLLGTGRGEDRLLLVDDDERFEMGISEGTDERLVLIHSSSTTTGRAWAWLPDTPAMRPIPVTGTTPGVLVTVESAGDHLLIVHTASTKEGSLAAVALPGDLTALAAPVGPDMSRGALGIREAGTALDQDEPTPIAPPATWMCLREPAEGERILDVEATSGYLALSMRSGSLTQVEVRERIRPLIPASSEDGPARPRPLAADEIPGVWGPGRFVEVGSATRTIHTVNGGRFEDALLRVAYQSMIQPPTTVQVDPATTRPIATLKVAEVPGWDPADFVEERVWVTARDGATRIPVTLVRRADARPDGTNPGWEIGYGSYEVSYDAEFSRVRLPVLARGVVMAIAHIRGGGELGRAWYEDGKALVKVHTFTDFIDVGAWLVDSDWVAPGRLVAEGRSAGGLLMGAVVNTAPAQYRAVLAGVPFVDALTTILDPSLPLTVGEWEEWGNPIEDPEVFAAMRAYTPYENVPEGVRLPAIMATTSVNDTRVEFVEPAKWVLRLRKACGANEDATAARHRPIVLRTQMVAGHAGPSGREGWWAARAEEFAFALGQIGVDA